jgi:hypothetical protein
MNIHRRRASGRPIKAHLSELVHSLARTLFDPYRPEQHYMRGPGPKWHAKHDGHDGEAVLVRVRVKR